MIHRLGVTLERAVVSGQESKAIYRWSILDWLLLQGFAVFFGFSLGWRGVCCKQIPADAKVVTAR